MFNIPFVLVCHVSRSIRDIYWQHLFNFRSAFQFLFSITNRILAIQHRFTAAGSHVEPINRRTVLLDVPCNVGVGFKSQTHMDIDSNLGLYVAWVCMGSIRNNR